MSAGSSIPRLFAKESTTGSIQLWQFLLELLSSSEHSDLLEWHGDEGEFRLLNPEKVAELWGRVKSKAGMNYEKMSRALRYEIPELSVDGERKLAFFFLDVFSQERFSAKRCLCQVPP